MGPKRKRQLIDDACAKSPKVDEAYKTLRSYVENHFQTSDDAAFSLSDDKEANKALFEKAESMIPKIKKAQAAFHTALKDSGVGAFFARDLATFVAHSHQNRDLIDRW